MSVPVDPAELASAVRGYGPTTYLVTTDPDGRPRVNQVSAQVEGDRVTATVGGSAARNLVDRPAAVLVWPPIEDEGFTLLADGQGRVRGDPTPGAEIEVVVSSAVQHRQAG